MVVLRFLFAFIFGSAAVGLTLVSGVAAGLSHFGRRDLEADILTHFAPFWLAGSLAGLLLALVALPRATKWVVAALATAAVLASGALIVPELVRSTGPKAKAGSPGELTVVQFNVWNRNTDPEGSVDWILAQKPDVVLLQESNPEIRRLIRERTGWESVCEPCDTTIFTALPMLASKRVPGDGPLVTATVRDGRGPFTVVGLHNAWPTDIADQQRQEKRLVDLLRRYPADRAIVTGDFNSTPWSFSRRRWDKEIGLIRRNKALFTWPARPYGRLSMVGAFPFLPIDHLYAGPGWATVSIKRSPKLGSDHYGVVMILAPVAPR
jgi:endonuclease/exonuclease/phosphatase (EEP) superfamily protein YafD